jgi:hypothetical protein
MAAIIADQTVATIRMPRRAARRFSSEKAVPISCPEDAQFLARQGAHVGRALWVEP